MPITQYKHSRTCECGYITVYPANWSTHKKRCKWFNVSNESLLLDSIKTQLADKERELANTMQQLVAKDRQLEIKDEQMKEKDEQIKELIKVAKKPRTVTTTNTNHNKYVVEQHINVFGKESIDHISSGQIQELLADPVNAVPQFIKLMRKAPGGVNKNVRVPSQKRAIYQVVVSGEDGEKEWEHQAKGDVLEQLYDDNSGHLEAEADEDTKVGWRFLNHQDKVKMSAGGEDGGRRYKEQLDKIHCVVSM